MVGQNELDGRAAYWLSDGDSQLFVTADVDAWHNPIQSFDVNSDGSVSAQDVLVIVNQLNNRGAHQLSIAPRSGTAVGFIDVNHDFHVTPMDALLITNFLNQIAAEAEASWFPVGVAIPTSEIRQQKKAEEKSPASIRVNPLMNFMPTDDAFVGPQSLVDLASDVENDIDHFAGEEFWQHLSRRGLALPIAPR
jgi:hypothetical protein